MIPFWQKVWILLKQVLLLLFWKTRLLQINPSRPQASLQAKPALPRGHLSIRAISSGNKRLLPPLPTQILEVLPCGQGWIFIWVLCWVLRSSLYWLPTSLEKKGRRKLAWPGSFSFFCCNKSAVSSTIELDFIAFFFFSFFSFGAVVFLRNDGRDFFQAFPSRSATSVNALKCVLDAEEDNKDEEGV